MSNKLNDDFPTFEQYANRLIEYVDSDFIDEAYNQYHALVASGLEPDLAFYMITSQR